jgi:putative transposase
VKKSRFSEEQIIGILKEQQAGTPTVKICRRHGIRDATFYTWRSRFGGIEISDARRPEALNEENRKLKKLLAETMRSRVFIRKCVAPIRALSVPKGCSAIARRHDPCCAPGRVLAPMTAREPIVGMQDDDVGVQPASAPIVRR